MSETGEPSSKRGRSDPEVNQEEKDNTMLEQSEAVETYNDEDDDKVQGIPYFLFEHVCFPYFTEKQDKRLLCFFLV